MTVDNRKYFRYDLPIELIFYSRNIFMQDHQKRFKTHNISAGGAYIKDNKKTNYKKDFNLKIVIINNELKTENTVKREINAVGSIIRQDDNGFAIKFKDIIDFNNYA